MKLRNANEFTHRPLSRAQRHRVIYHEAGHVVAALMCGEHIYDVHLGKPEFDYEIEDRHGRVIQALGMTETSMDSHGDPYAISTTLQAVPAARGPLMASVSNSVFLDGAGYAAEGRVARWSSAARTLAAVYSSDWLSATASMGALGFDASHSRRLVVEIWDETEKFIKGQNGWPAVEAVAAAILDGAPAEEIEEIGLSHLGEVLPPGGLIPIYLPVAFRKEWQSLMNEWFRFTGRPETASDAGACPSNA